MATVKSLVNGLEAIPIIDEAMIMCPVEDTGRNSVSPSTIASIMASSIDMY
jgi:hypothetical protein